MALYDHGPTMVIARALTTAEAGWAVPAVLDHMRVWLTADRGMDLPMFQMLQREVYRALKADARVTCLGGTAQEGLQLALYTAEVLDFLGDGADTRPTGWAMELMRLPPDLTARWCAPPETCEEMEALVRETVGAVLREAPAYPLALEVTRYLVTYLLAAELEKVQPAHYPRQETARCIKLAKYLTPWDSFRSCSYICHRRGEIFLLDGDIDAGSCEDYLDAIRQAERSLPRDILKRHLTDRTAQPCFDFELEKAVKLWLGSEYKRWGKIVK